MPTATQATYSRDVRPPKINTSYRSLSLNPPSAASAKGLNMMSPTTRELPMPTVTRITSLAQAQATLQHCWTKLSGSGPTMTPSHMTSAVSPVDSRDQRRYYQRWLEQWERAFTAYLSSAMSGMKGDGITRCRILKANHLACTVLAAEPTADPRSFDVFDAEFQAIVELASAVIHSQAASTSPGSASSRSSSPSESTGAAFGLDMQEPLQVVVARCNRYAVRNNAIALLSRP